MNKNPETRSGGIVDQLQFHREGRTVPDDFSLAKIKREIDSLIKVDSSTGYMVKGILYSLIGEADKSIENHNKSLLLAFRVDSYENYFTSLIALNKFPEAYKLAIDAITKSPGLPKFLEQGIRAAYRVGKLAEMMELYQQYTKVMSHQEQKEDILSLVDNAERLLSVGADPEQLAVILTIASKVVIPLYYIGVSPELLQHGEEYSLFITANITPEGASAANDIVCDFLSEIEISLVDKFSLVFLSRDAA